MPATARLKWLLRIFAGHRSPRKACLPPLHFVILTKLALSILGKLLSQHRPKLPHRGPRHRRLSQADLLLERGSRLSKSLGDARLLPAHPAGQQLLAQQLTGG